MLFGKITFTVMVTRAKLNVYISIRFEFRIQLVNFVENQQQMKFICSFSHCNDGREEKNRIRFIVYVVNVCQTQSYSKSASTYDEVCIANHIICRDSLCMGFINACVFAYRIIGCIASDFHLG